jgi:hypothetical protein
MGCFISIGAGFGMVDALTVVCGDHVRNLLERDYDTPLADHA